MRISGAGFHSARQDGGADVGGRALLPAALLAGADGALHRRRQDAQAGQAQAGAVAAGVREPVAAAQRPLRAAAAVRRHDGAAQRRNAAGATAAEDDAHRARGRDFCDE